MNSEVETNEISKYHNFNKRGVNMRRLSFVLVATVILMLSASVASKASDFPPDPQGVKVIDRAHTCAIEPWMYAVLYDKGNDRVIEIYQAFDYEWQKVVTKVYRKGMDAEYKKEFPFEILYIEDSLEDGNIYLFVIGMLETEAGLAISYDPDTGKFIDITDQGE